MDDSGKWFAEGVSLYEKGDFQRAIAAFDKSIAADAGKAEVWNNRGLCLIQTGQYQEALQSINRALSLHPGYENARKAKKIVLGLTNTQEAAGSPASSGIPSQEGAPSSKRPSKMFTIAIIVIFVVGIGGILVVKSMQGQDSPFPQVFPTPTTIPVTTVPTPVPTATPVPTPTLTPMLTPTPKPIPLSGVWVEVNYSQYYSGSLGIPGNQQQLAGSQQVMPNTGDRFYFVPVSNGIVTASVKKNDGSGDTLAVTIYRDGATVRTASTALPYGTVDLTVVLSTPSPTLPAANSTDDMAAPAGA